MNYLGLLSGLSGGGGTGAGSSLTIVNTSGGDLTAAAAANNAAAERIDRGATWSDPEVDELLNIWTNGNVQAELKEATIKKHIFERIARSLRDKGFYRTAEQCREKIKRLKKEYRQAMNNNYRCVRGRATVKFFPRLQAVLDGSRQQPLTKSFYEAGGNGNSVTSNNLAAAAATTKVDEHGEVTVIASTNVTSSYSGGGYGINLKSTSSAAATTTARSLHAYSECSAEEIKVDVNPAEVDGDSYVDADRRNYLTTAVAHRRSLPAVMAHQNHHQHNHHPQQQHHQLTRSLSLQRRIRIGNGITGPVNLCTADDEHDDATTLVMDNDEEEELDDDDDDAGGGGSSGAGSVTPTRDDVDDRNSPDFAESGSNKRKRNKPHRRKSNGGVAIGSSQTFRDTLDTALDRFLKHQRESEERLFAWEERRIQMELEAEERFRQEDREMLRQIFANLGHQHHQLHQHHQQLNQQSPAVAAASSSASSAVSNPEPSPSSSGGSHSNDR